jgi:hypothetical protein
MAGMKEGDHVKRISQARKITARERRDTGDERRTKEQARHEPGKGFVIGSVRLK